MLSGLCNSKGECRRLVQGGGLYLNNVRITSLKHTVSHKDLVVDGTRFLLRSGKRRRVVVSVR